MGYLKWDTMSKPHFKLKCIFLLPPFNLIKVLILALNANKNVLVYVFLTFYTICRCNTMVC